METIEILGVKIDKVNYNEALSNISEYIRKSKKASVFTPNIEIIMAAQADNEFKKVLNKSTLSIPDSSRLGWAELMINQVSIFNKILLWPFFLFPKIIPKVRHFPVTTGTELMQRLISLSEEKGFVIGFLGGSNGVAERLKKCLLKKHPALNIRFCSSNITVDQNGNSTFDILNTSKYRSNDIKDIHPVKAVALNIHQLSENMDILFVALGQIKQEKWIYKNLPKLNTKVMIGVGGAFDYLSESIPRAPKLIRDIGMEWLFRLIVQPWRIKRFGSLVRFIFKVLIYKA
jgi:N-acetylglucosaminyldiphosphoundecaprenol N-acetyl-beta-D-mannosaminyltransferase